MTTKEIAERLVALCRQGQFETAHKELFATDVISTEPYGTPTFAKETKGLNAILEKGDKFTALIDLRAVYVQIPRLDLREHESRVVTMVRAFVAAANTTAVA